MTASSTAAQVRDSTFRLFTVHSPPELARVDTLFGQSPDWAGQPPDGGLTARLILARDGSGNYLGCNPLINAAEVAGNVAFIRRGTCEFGLKALHAQNAGAVAFIVYAVPTPPVEECYGFPMAPGIYGTLVTIPGAIYATRAGDCEGQPLRSFLEAGTEIVVTLAPLFIGVATEPGADEVTHALSSVEPNPFTGTATFTLKVAHAQGVVVTVHDALGRRVSRLFDGPLAADAPHSLTLDGTGLVPGVYLLRAAGESFVETRRIVRIR